MAPVNCLLLARTIRMRRTEYFILLYHYFRNTSNECVRLCWLKTAHFTLNLCLVQHQPQNSHLQKPENETKKWKQRKNKRKKQQQQQQLKHAQYYNKICNLIAITFVRCVVVLCVWACTVRIRYHFLQVGNCDKFYGTSDGTNYYISFSPSQLRPNTMESFRVF